MRRENPETQERLIRVRTIRRGAPVELTVHYEIDRVDGCDTYRLLSLEESE